MTTRTIPFLTVGIFLLCRPAFSAEYQATDGDTAKVTVAVSYRIRGIDAPEVSGCSKEKGLQARAELQALLSSGDVEIHPVMRDDGEYDLDKYGRRLAVIFAGGKNVAEVLIEKGLAKLYDGKGPRPEWCE